MGSELKRRNKEVKEMLRKIKRENEERVKGSMQVNAKGILSEVNL